jgi:hypothetical protein
VCIPTNGTAPTGYACPGVSRLPTSRPDNPSSGGIVGLSPSHTPDIGAVSKARGLVRRWSGRHLLLRAFHAFNICDWLRPRPSATSQNISRSDRGRLVVTGENHAVGEFPDAFGVGSGVVPDDGPDELLVIDSAPDVAGAGEFGRGGPSA